MYVAAWYIVIDGHIFHCDTHEDVTYLVRRLNGEWQDEPRVYEWNNATAEYEKVLLDYVA